MINETAMDGIGMFHLERVQHFFHLMKIDLKNVKVMGDRFDFGADYYDNTFDFDFDEAERFSPNHENF